MKNAVVLLFPVARAALDRAPGDELMLHGLQAGVISDDEKERVIAAESARTIVIQVDALDADDIAALR